MRTQRIQEVQKKQRELSSKAVLGEYKANARGEIFFANQHLATILDYGSAEEMVSANVFSWCRNASDGKRFMELLKDPGQIENLEIETLTRGGKLKQVLLSATLNLGTIQGTMKDITEIRELDHRLLQSQKLESLGTLAGGIAHDFNNILGIIQGHLMILERYSDDPVKYDRSLKAIQQATLRGATLTKQILTFARERAVAMADVRVNDVITELAKLLLETFPRSIDISTFLSGNQPFIAGDTHLLHQMLFNLCINARDAMPQGGQLSITTSVVEGRSLYHEFAKATTGRYIRIDISDTGLGMDKITLQRLFEPFFTTKTPERGTGLGLSIVKGIIDSHRGFIGVQSSPGAGTRFIVYLPVREQVPEPAVVEQTGFVIEAGTETILLIEDELWIRELMETILTAHGYSVILAGDGAEGLQVFLDRHKEIDLIISDLGLPKLGGAEMLELILSRSPDAQIIVASGFVDQEAKLQLEQLGIRHIIPKPYSPDAVLHMVREVLDKKK